MTEEAVVPDAVEARRENVERRKRRMNSVAESVMGLGVGWVSR